MNYNTVSFPGLGIGEFTINPTAIRFSDHFTIEWYAIIICIAILCAYFCCDRLAKRFSIKGEDILDVLLFSLPIGFIGARVWYILGDLQSFDSFMDMISVWNGGLAIYGGIIFSVATAYFVCRYKKISFANMADLGAIGFMIGQMIGRWGNFANVEVFGVHTELPWRMGVGVDCIAEYVHPLFLYESLWNLIGLLAVLAYMDSRKFKGELFLLYCGWYGIGRAWMESLRDTSYNLHLFGLRINLVLAIAIAVIAIGLLIFLHIKKPSRLLREKAAEKMEAADAYQPQFDYVEEDELAEEEASSEINDEEIKDGEDY